MTSFVYTPEALDSLGSSQRKLTLRLDVGDDGRPLWTLTTASGTSSPRPSPALDLVTSSHNEDLVGMLITVLGLSVEAVVCGGRCSFCAFPVELCADAEAGYEMFTESESLSLQKE